MADPRIEQARSMADLGQFKEAVGLLKVVIKDDPSSVPARELLGDIQDSMMLELQIADKLAQAQAMADKGQFDAAKKILTEVLAVAPNHPRARLLRAQLSEPDAPPPLGPDATIALDAFDLSELNLDAQLGGGETVQPPASPSAQPPVAALPPLPPLVQASPIEATFLSGSATSLGPSEKAKVEQYIREGKALLDQGKFQEAIDVWTRVFILDENNKEADALIASAKEASAGGQREVEHFLTEGIAAFNTGNFSRAKPLLEKVLEAFPGHREALYYLGRITESASGGAPAAAPAAPSFGLHEAASEGGGGGFSDGFEFEDHLDLPMGESMRAAAPGPALGGFEFDEPSPPPPVPVSGQAPPAPASAGADAQGDVLTDQELPDWEVPLPPGGVVGGPSETAASHVPVQPGEGRARPGPGRSGARVWLLVGVAAAILLVVSVGILIATILFRNDEGSMPSAVVHGKLPKPEKPQIALSKPDQSASSPVAESPEQTLRAAQAAENEKDFAKAIKLYQEVLVRPGNGLNSEAASGLAEARQALLRQQAENSRNEKFLKDYMYAVKAYHDGDFPECLRVAWRLVYPDDTLARQLGKRDQAAKLIRDGYFNWAVMDLKSENVRGADKNLKDLLDFDHNDPEARKLQQFIRPYLNGGADQNYRDTVRGLSYRPFSENP